MRHDLPQTSGVQISYTDPEGKDVVEECPWYIGREDAQLYAEFRDFSRLQSAGRLESLADQSAALNVAAALCQRNPAFLGHQYMNIRLKQGGRARFNNWTPGQRKLYQAIRQQQAAKQPVRIIILKARRQGISTLCELMAFNRTAFYRDAHALIAAHKEKSAKAIRGMFDVFLDSLPAPLCPMIEKDNIDLIKFDNPDRKERRQAPGLGSSISQLTVALGGGKKEEQGKGRGETYQFIHASEAAYWAEPEEFWHGVSQTVDESDGTSILIESTANGFGWFFDLWQEASKGWQLRRDKANDCIDWHCVNPMASRSSLLPVFLSWLEEPTYRWPFENEKEKQYMLSDLDEEESALISDFGADPEQLNWRRRILYGEKFNSDIQKFHQEYPTTPRDAFISSGRKVFDMKALQWAERLIRNSDLPGKRGSIWLDSVGAPTRDNNEDGFITFWREPVEDADYAIGVDASYGKKHGDSTCIQVLRCDNWEQVAKAHGHIPADMAAEIAVALHRLYNGAISVIEVNGPGLAILTKMDELGCDNFYFRTVPDDSTGAVSKSFGWWTSTKSRTNMVARLRESVRDMPTGEGIILHDHTTIQEMMGWTVKVSPSGKAKEAPASSGGHDDTITSLGLALVGGIIEQGIGTPIISQKVGQVAQSGKETPNWLNLPWKRDDKNGNAHPVLGMGW